MDLNAIRREIDEIDGQILDLFIRRMECARRVAEYKIENGIPVLNAARENEILERISARAGKYGGGARMVYSALMEVSRALQHEMLGAGGNLRDVLALAASGAEPEPAAPKIACQGVAGAYSGQAAGILYPEGEICYYQRFEDVFEALQRDEADFGVVPVENSTAGSVSEVYDLMLRHRFYINKGVNLGISHCLLGTADADMAEIRRVYSHPQALLQCSGFLKSRGLEPVSCSNTAAAAALIAESGDSSAAAIASAHAAEHYGLKILARGVQNSGTNSTRFAAISKHLRISENADRISLAFALPHVTGSLYRTLARFAIAGLNLTKIESRPVQGRDFEYLFYLDFVGTVRREGIVNLLCALSDELPDFAFLGNYPQLERTAE